MAAVGESLYRVVTEAINDILEHGYDSPRRVQEWLEKIELAISRSLIPLEALDTNLRKLLAAVFSRTTRTDKLMRLHRGVSKYTLAQIQPKLRAELDKAILASADLIKLRREQAKAETLRRFAGWATSIPAGGTDIADRAKVRKDVRKGIAGLSFVERRVVIDQGHKLSAAVNRIVAVDGGAIAFVWHSHWREIGYDYRPSHKKRDEKIYGLRGSWAHQNGYLKRGADGWYDEITAAAEEPFCRCYVTAVYTLGELAKVAPGMLTEKGREKLREVQAQMQRFEAVS